jgi:hypothetical protein
MEGSCLNCNHPIVENFCSNCGQKKFKRIDKKYVLDEIQYTLLHTNKGLFYSIKKIIKNPGKTAREYINGNRINHYKPVLLVFLLSGISTFISYKILGFAEVMNAINLKKYGDAQFMSDFMSFVSNYNAIIMLMLVPLFAITTKIAFWKWGQNYYEHIVMNCYIVSSYTLVSMLIIYPIMFALKTSPNAFFTISQLSLLLVPIILIWFFKGFYNEKSIKVVVLRSLASFGIVIIGYIIVIIITSIIFIILSLTTNPELQHYFKPK